MRLICGREFDVVVERIKGKLRVILGVIFVRRRHGNLRRSKAEERIDGEWTVETPFGPGWRAFMIETFSWSSLSRT
jgi:hypothetical protein